MSPPQRTDEEGRFRIRGIPPGGYKLLARADGYGKLDAGTLTFQEKDAVNGKILRLIPGGSVAGTVRTTAGVPASGVFVMATLDGDREPSASSICLDDGTFRLGGLSPGHYEVRAGFFGQSAETPVEVRAGETATASLTLADGT